MPSDIKRMDSQNQKQFNSNFQFSLSFIAWQKVKRDWDFCLENAVVFGGFFAGRLRTDAEAESRLTYSSVPFQTGLQLS